MPEIKLSPEVLMALQAAVALVGAYLFVFWLGLVVWTFQDIRRRTENWFGQFFAVLLVLMFGLPGAIIYMLLRPGETLAQQYDRALEEEALLQELDERFACPSCKRTLRPEFVVCPFCQTQVRRACGSCGQALSMLWKACPYCTTPVPAVGELLGGPRPATPTPATATSERSTPLLGEAAPDVPLKA